MSKWEEKRLNQLCNSIFSGGTPATTCESYWGGDFFWLTSGETKKRFIYRTDKTITLKGIKNSSTRMAEREDVVMACAGQGKTRGQTSILKEDMYINQSVIAFSAKRECLLPTFLFYNLTNRYNELRALSDSSSTRGSITTEMLKNLSIFIPPKPIQQKIADILSAYDDLIENNNRRIELLEQAAQELYKEWFVQLRFPGYESARFTKGIPDGWKVVKLEDVINITSSKRIFLSDYVENGVPFYRSKEVIQLANGQAITEPLFIEKDKYNQIKTRFGVPIENDILLTSVGTIGISLLIKNDKPFYFKDGNLTWLQSSKKPLFALYLYLWLNSDSGKQQILASTIGTSQSALTIESLNRIKLIKPDDIILKEFSKIIQPINLQLENLRTQNQNLIKQRDLLLPRLMNGKIEV